MKQKAFFLDRDGVVNATVTRNGDPCSPRTLEELQILPGVALSVRRLKTADYLVIVVTNQPEVKRGIVTRETVELIHDYLRAQLPIDDIAVCYHDDDDECPCRKPRPGLLFAAAKHWDIDLSSSFLVGDRLKDIQAGHQANCRTFLIDAPYNKSDRVPYGLVVPDLSEAVDIVLNSP